MPTGAITGYIDVAQLVLYAFWIFFAGLIYLPASGGQAGGLPARIRPIGIDVVQGFPPMPASRRRSCCRMAATSRHPRSRSTPVIAAKPVAWLGAPLEPTGNPMVDAVGPAAYAERDDTPERTLDGAPKIVAAAHRQRFVRRAEDPDPRGMPVIGADGKVAGTVTELWVDRAEPQIRYLEVEAGRACWCR